MYACMYFCVFIYTYIVVKSRQNLMVSSKLLYCPQVEDDFYMANVFVVATGFLFSWFVVYLGFFLITGELRMPLNNWRKKWREENVSVFKKYNGSF